MVRNYEESAMTGFDPTFCRGTGRPINECECLRCRPVLQEQAPFRSSSRSRGAGGFCFFCDLHQNLPRAGYQLINLANHSLISGRLRPSALWAGHARRRPEQPADEWALFIRLAPIWA